jgi:hypothetical protein
LSGPRESPSSGSTNRPWSGRLRHNNNPTNTGDASYKGKEKVGEAVGMPDISAGYSHVDGESSGSEQSLVALSRALMRSLGFRLSGHLV